MQFLTFASTFVAIFPSIIAVDTNPYNTSAGALASNYPGGLDFYSNCWEVKGCKWEQAVDNFNVPISNANQCSCNKNPDKWDDIIWFYTKPAYTGDLFKGFGHYGECQDLPTLWRRKTESFQLAPSPAAICHIYTQPGCGGAAGIFVIRDSTNPNENAIKQFQGYFYKGVQSWKCVRKTS